MPEHPQASEEAEEPSPLEYARSNGLSRDYLAERLGFSDLEQLQHVVDAKQLDSSHLRQFNLGSEIRVEERLTISKDAALLLSSINREEASEDIDSLVVSMLDTRTLGWPPKLELSLLRSNHETDCREFASREGFEIKLQDVKLPLELVDDEKNEGLSWPSRFWDMGPETLQKLKAEKLAVSKDAFMFINDCLKDDWTEDDAKALWNDEQKYKKVRGLYVSSIAKLSIYHRILHSNPSRLHCRQDSSHFSNLTSHLLPILLTNFRFSPVPNLRRNSSSKTLRS